jgi:hypothetical protein
LATTKVLELRTFKHADELIDFLTAARIGLKHGFGVEKLL